MLKAGTYKSVYHQVFELPAIDLMLGYAFSQHTKIIMNDRHINHEGRVHLGYCVDQLRLAFGERISIP